MELTCDFFPEYIDTADAEPPSFCLWNVIYTVYAGDKWRKEYTYLFCVIVLISPRISYIFWINTWFRVMHNTPDQPGMFNGSYGLSFFIHV